MKIGFVADALSHFDTETETTSAMMFAAQQRGWEVYHMHIHDLSVVKAKPYATLRQMRNIQLIDDPAWYELEAPKQIPLSKLDIVMMRKDPPFDMDFIYATYILELAEREGVLVVNKPQSLRDCNEKMFINWFPHCITDTLISCNAQQIKAFVAEYHDVIFKPLDGKGGASIFRIRQNDANINVTIELMTNFGQRQIMVQRYLPEIKDGDKRILMINGEAVPYALARFAKSGETRANISAGGSVNGMSLNEREHWLCQQVGPTLREKGLLFVGLDVIGGFITEINVTSPTCVRQLDAQFGLNISAQLCEVMLKVCQKV